MIVNLQIISNIIVPSIAGLFFFIYFIYFVIVNQSRAVSFFYFIIFLISFSLFLLGRPLQLLLGQHPVQLITVNIRMVIFCFFSITSITAATNLFSNKNSFRSQVIIFGLGAFLGIVYVVFNTLGTTGSIPIFEWGGTTAYETLTPTGRAPFYGREITIAVQVTIGFLLLSTSLFHLISDKPVRNFKSQLENKVFLFNSGVLLFALTFIIGSFTKQWWIYYFFSMFSALLFGAGVVQDIKELYNNYEKLIPIIKEDIIQNVAFSHYSKKKLEELLHCLGKSVKLDTFILISMPGYDKDDNYEQITKQRISGIDRVTKILVRDLNRSAGIMNYLIIPQDDRKIGVVLNILNNLTFSELHTLTLFEEIQLHINNSCSMETAIGIGRSYANLEDLRTSYYEALNALEYAEKMAGNSLIHVNNISTEDDGETRFPTREKVKLLTALKGGDRISCIQAMESFLEQFRKFVITKPESLKLRLYELAGASIDGAIMAGGDENQLNRLVKESFRDIELLNSFEKAETWLKDFIDRILMILSKTQKTRAAVIIDKAKAIIDTRFSEQISYKDIAGELYISSSYFLALFKQETGSTFVEYLTELRMHHSKRLLLNSNMTITEISFEVGINNPNYFSSIFKKTTGISAKEFRKQNRAFSSRS